MLCKRLFSRDLNIASTKLTTFIKNILISSKKLILYFQSTLSLKFIQKENLYDLLVMVNRTKVEKNPLDLKIEYS